MTVFLIFLRAIAKFCRRFSDVFKFITRSILDNSVSCTYYFSQLESILFSLGGSNTCDTDEFKTSNDFAFFGFVQKWAQDNRFPSELLVILLEALKAVLRRCPVKKMFLKMSQNHRKLLVSESLLSNVAGLRLFPGVFTWKHRCFPVNFTNFLKTTFL